MRTCDHGAKRRNKTRKRFVKGEQAEILGGDLWRCCFRFAKGFLVRRDVLGVQRSHLEQVQRDAALIASAEPLGILGAAVRFNAAVQAQRSRYQLACLLKFFDLDGLEQVINFLVLAPVLGVLELLEGFLRHEATRTQESTANR